MDKLREGIDLYLAGDYSAAIRTLKSYIEEGGPSLGTAYYHIGVAYSDLQKLPEAGENLMKAVELEPEKSMYHYRLGVVYSRLMVLDKAIEQLSRSLELNPEHQRSRYILGTIYFQRGDIKKAYETFSQIISASPDFADAYYRRALCSYHSGKEKESAQDLLKALDINPEYDEVRLKLAHILLNNKEYAGAAENCGIIYNNGARDYVFLKYFIYVLSKAGMKDKAREIAAEALILYPHNQDIQNISKETFS